MGGIVVERYDQTVSELLKQQGPFGLGRSVSEMAGVSRFPDTKKIGSTRVGSVAESAESATVGATGSIMALMDSETRQNHFHSQRYMPQASQRHSQSSWWKDIKQLGSRRPAARKWEPISEEVEQESKAKSSKKGGFWKKLLPKGKKDKSSKNQGTGNTDLGRDAFKNVKDFDFWNQQSTNTSNKPAIKSQSVRNGESLQFSTDSPGLQRQGSAPLWQRRNMAPVSGLDSSRLKMNRSARVGSVAALAMAAAVQESIPE